MKVWALTDGPVKEGKFLVVRRDGTVPKWGHFVMSLEDPCVANGLTAYAAEAERLGMEADFVESVRVLSLQSKGLAIRRRAQSIETGEKGPDPDAGPHRQDNPVVIAMMRGEADVAALAAELVALREQVDMIRWRPINTVPAKGLFYVGRPDGGQMIFSGEIFAHQNSAPAHLRGGWTHWRPMLPGPSQ